MQKILPEFFYPIPTDCQQVTPPYIPSPKGRGFTADLISWLNMLRKRRNESGKNSQGGNIK